MVTASEFAPSPQLAPFIHAYAYREFDTHGKDFIKPWHASHKPIIYFFFKDLPVKLTDTKRNKILKRGENCDVVGISTKYNGDVTVNGKYSYLQIIFQPHGFHTLFNVPPREIADRIVCVGDILNSDIQLLHERLSEAETAQSMAKLANDWLLIHLNKKKPVDYKDRITISANMITKNPGLVNIETLAQYACMSMRNFERIFINETGMSPKQLCCISRFNNALELKLKYPSMKWISVAHQAGYFDQMHLIKDFKRFCGDAPASLIKKVPLLEQNYISRYNS